MSKRTNQRVRLIFVLIGIIIVHSQPFILARSVVRNEAIIEYDTPVTAKKAVREARNSGLTVTQLIALVDNGDETATFGYVVKESQSPKKIQQKMTKLYNETMEIIAENSGNVAKNSIDKIKIDRVFVSSESVIDVPKVISSFKENVRIITNETVNEPSNQLPLPSLKNDKAFTNYQPSNGTVVSGEDGPNRRYIYQQMKWTDTSGFDWWWAYEHDFYLNPQGGSYLTTGQNLDGTPTVFWYSDLPGAYLDSRTDDNTDEKLIYTIGSVWAEDIKVNKTYESLIGGNNGLANADHGTLWAQLGQQHCNIPWTWCVTNALDTTWLSTEWEIAVPGLYVWKWPDDAEPTPTYTNTPPGQPTPTPTTNPGTNLLSNSGFESGLYPWRFFPTENNGCAWTRDYSGAHSGSKMLSTHRPAGANCYSLSQDISYIPKPGETYTLAMYGRRGWDGDERKGTLAIWALGGSQENAGTPFNLNGSWKCVSVQLDVNNSGHTGIRAEVYLDSIGHPDFQLDTFTLVKGDYLLCP